MKKEIILTGLLFGMGLAAALTIENVFSGTKLSSQNISIHLLAGLVGGVVFGLIVFIIQGKKKNGAK